MDNLVFWPGLEYLTFVSTISGSFAANHQSWRLRYSETVNRGKTNHEYKTACSAGSGIPLNTQSSTLDRIRSRQPYAARRARADDEAARSN